MMVLTSLCCSLLCLHFSYAFDEHLKFDQSYHLKREEDRIVSLPGVSKLPDFEMFSGYLDVDNQYHLFYWLVKSQDTSSGAIALWFNGGPGCSSLDGFFYEHGPLMFDKTSGQLAENPYSWNKYINIVYIETPVSTGFSYSDNLEELNFMDDDSVAEINLKALKQFYLLYPEFERFDLYITGESYAGVYIPLLTQLIVDEKSQISDNLRGILIGNGLLEKYINHHTVIDYGFYHGLISPSLFKEVNRLCITNGELAGSTNFNPTTNECVEMMETARNQILNSGLNIYNYVQDCAPMEELASESQRRFFAFKTFFNEFDVDEYKLVPECSNATLITRYLNNKEVQKSIHAKVVHKSSWELCSMAVLRNYTQQEKYADMSEVFRKIINYRPDVRVVLFFGDLDLACNFYGGEIFADNLGFEVTTSRRKWTVEKNGAHQLAGYYKEYDSLSFVTFKAAGHMVPTDKPAESLELLRRVLYDEPI